MHRFRALQAQIALWFKGFRAMTASGFSQRLAAEFDQRKARNRRYSVRAFAAALGADHGTVAQVLRGVRAATEAQIRDWSARLGFSEVEAMVYAATRSHESPERAAQTAALAQNAAEALELVNEPVHWVLLAHIHAHGTLPHLSEFAAAHGRPVDAAQIALARLLRLGWMVPESVGRFRDATGTGGLNATAFQRFVAERTAGLLGLGQAGSGDAT